MIASDVIQVLERPMTTMAPQHPAKNRRLRCRYSGYSPLGWIIGQCFYRRAKWKRPMESRKRAIKLAASAHLTKKVLELHRDEPPFRIAFFRLSPVARTFEKRYRPDVAPKCTGMSTLAQPRDEANSKTDTHHCFNPPDWTMACQTTSPLWKLPRKRRVLGNRK